MEPASKMCEVLAKRAMQALEDTNTDSAEGEDLIDASLRGMRTFAEISQTFLECTTAAIDDETAITYAEAAAEALRVSCVVHPDVATQSLLVFLVDVVVEWCCSLSRRNGFKRRGRLQRDRAIPPIL